MNANNVVKSPIFSIVVNLCFLFLLTLVGVGTYRLVGQAHAILREEKDSQKRIHELVIKKNELEAALAELQTPEGIEKEAKKRLNLKLPGESVVVVPPEKGPEELSLIGGELSWWQRARNFLLGN